MLKKAISFFIILSFFTRTLSVNRSSLLGRLTVADVFGGLAILLFVYKFNKIKITKTNLSNFLLLLLLVPGLFVTLSVKSTAMALLILFFLLIISIVLFNTFNSKKGLENLIFLFSLAGLLSSLTGIWDTFAMFLPIPQIFPSRSAGESLSGFRNAGQAGAYMLIVLTILIPLKGSKLFFEFGNKTKKTIKYSIIFSTIFLLLTGKIAAYIGISIGVFLYLLLRRKYIMILPLSLLFGIVVIITPYVEIIAPVLYNRLNHKVQSRVVKKVTGEQDVSDGFIAKNFSLALEVFKNKPLTGSGISGIGGGNYSSHEIHSTYFKMIGETGILGVIGYCIFIFTFLSNFFMLKNKKENPYANYLSLMLPFILGCLISWGYTFHLRKREFYILLTIVSITFFLAKQYNLKTKKKDY